jgi:hypothetical protein
VQKMKNRLIAGLMAVLLLTACSGGDGGGTSREDLLKLAGESVPAMATTTPEARIEATVTPDVYLPQPAPFIAPTATPDAIQAMPAPTAAPVVVQDLQTLAIIGQVCDPYTAREIPLDDADRAAGVVVKGGGCVEVTR